MSESNVLNEAKRLHGLGFAIIWIEAKSKKPVESGWTTGERKKWSYLKETYNAGYNVGVRLGTPSAIKARGGFLAVLDVDIKSSEERHRKEATKAVTRVFESIKGGAKAVPCVSSGRKGGSRHYYMVSDAPFKTFNPFASDDMVKVLMPSKRISKKDRENLSEDELKAGYRWSRAWELSLYSDGRQVVLPPSVHPDTGSRYEWKRDVSSVDDMPFITLETLKAFDVESDDGNAHGEGATIGMSGKLSGAEKAALDEKSDAVIAGFEVDETCDVRWLPKVKDEIRTLIIDGVWRGEEIPDRSAYLPLAAVGLHRAGCTLNEILNVLTDKSTILGDCAYDHAQTKHRKRAAAWLYKYSVKKALDELDPKQVFAGVDVETPRTLDADEAKEQADETKRERNWRQDLSRAPEKNGEAGKVLDRLNNLDLIFTNGVVREGKSLFQKDLFANRESYAASTPWGRKRGDALTDVDIVLIKSWLANSEFQFEPKDQTISQAMMLCAHRNSNHPVRDYLNGLKWDGKKRISTWLKDYLNAKAPEPYLSEISKKFLIAMVTRVFEPGCQWDYTLVLEGKQGARKSTVARVLAGNAWFCDHLPDLHDKDAMLNLNGSWLVELGELKNIKSSDTATVKAFLTRRTDRVRAPYGKRWEDLPRQSVFIGTVNENEFLKDPTGNRRFWPVVVKQCDADRLAEDRDQLFAEAVYEYKMGSEKLYLEGLAHEQSIEEQESKRIDDDQTDIEGVLIDSLGSWHSTPPDIRFNYERFKIRDLLNSVLSEFRHKPYAIQNIATALHRQGFKKRKINGQRIWTKPLKDLWDEKYKTARDEFKRGMRRKKKKMCNNSSE